MLKWFESYLSDRKQFVCFNGYSSDLLLNKCGVPQGSVLGPLLFLLYINDLPNVSKLLQFYLFADDTIIYYESSSFFELEKTLNKELRKLYLWLNVNRLSLNIGKTNFIIFHPYNKPVKSCVTILIDKKAISEKNYLKYLGVIVDSTLSWNHQISSVTKKISRAIGIMYKLRDLVPLSVLMSIYYSLIYSHIVYAIEVWGSAFKTEMDKILILQKRAVRLMTFADKLPDIPGNLRPSNPIFFKLQILKVVDVYKYQLIKFIFKCLNQLTPLQFHNWFVLTYQVHLYQTRVSYRRNLFIPSVRTSNYGLKQLRPKIWNELPSLI